MMMTPSPRIFLLVMLALIIGGLALLFSPDTRGQAQSDGWRALLADMTARDGVLLLGFSAPLAVTGERSRLVEDANQIELGEDYLCFSEAWNNGQRKTCTPLSNISSVTFTAP